MSDYYAVSGTPGTSSQGASASMRAEFALVSAGFDKLPAMTGNGNKAVVVNAGGTALTVTVGALALAAAFTLSGAFATTLTVTAPTNITLPTTGTLATLAGAEELTNKTLNASVGKGVWTASGTWTLPALTLGGTVSGGGQQLNNIIIGTATPLAGAFTTLSATGNLTTNVADTRVMYSSSLVATGSANLTFNGTTLTAHTLTVSTGALTVTGGTITTGAATALSLATTGGTQFQIVNTAGATRYITVTGSATNPILGVSGGALSISGQTNLSCSSNTVMSAISGDVADYVLQLLQQASSGANPKGLQISYNAFAPNDTTHYFANFADNAANRVFFYSNGGLGNFSANNVNLSDKRTKSVFQTYRDDGLIVPLWEAHKRIQWGRHKYNDQTHDDWNHGYTAQGIQTAFAGVANEIVGDWDATGKLLAVYNDDLHNISGAVLTEAQVRIDDLLAWKAKAETTLAQRGITIN